MKDDRQSPKPKNWPMIVVIGITALTVIIAFGAKSSLSYLKALQRRKLPYYSLEVMGNDLVFRTFQNGKPEVLKTITTRPKSDINMSEKNGIFTITSGSTKVANVNKWETNMEISPKNQAVFYTESVQVPSTKPGQTFSKYYLNTWDHKGGKIRLTPMLSHIMTVKLSLDEKTLIATYYDENVMPQFGTFLYDIPARKGVLVGPPAFPNNVSAVIDSDNVIIMVPKQMANGSYTIAFQAYNLKTKTYGPFYVDDTVQEIMAFNGSIWCRAQSPGKQSILRLNKTFDKVEERFDFPATNPEP